MKKWLAASAISLLMVFLTMSTTFAAPLGLRQGTSVPKHASSGLVQMHPNSSVVSCSGYGCDNLYAYPSNSNTPGTNCGGSWVGWFTGEPHWSKMYYSSSCGTNFAYVTSSPDGSAIIEVDLWRRPPGGSRHGFLESTNPNYVPYCASSGVYPPDDYNSFCDADNIPNGAHSWLGNMLYAPVDQVEVCVSTVAHPSPDTYCSYWH